MTSKSRIAYIEPNDAGKPCCTLAHLLAEVVDNAQLSRIGWAYSGITNTPAKNRRKVRITITVEAVP